jgi:hypothetical protein
VIGGDHTSRVVAIAIILDARAIGRKEGTRAGVCG